MARIVLIKIVWVLLIALTTNASAGSPSARDVVQQASDELLVLIEQGRPYVDEDPERFFVAVEALLNPVVDFAGFSRNVMATHYKRATDEQRLRFAETFKWGLVKSYALALLEFSDGEVVLIPPGRPPRSKKRESVKMEIRTGSGEVYPLVYSMALSQDDVWRMRNIIINGVNIGLTYRSQFASAANDGRYGGDLDKVIDAWTDVVELDEGDAEESAATESGGEAGS